MTPTLIRKTHASVAPHYYKRVRHTRTARAPQWPHYRPARQECLPAGDEVGRASENGF